jgi:hypothetical protein
VAPEVQILYHPPKITKHMNYTFLILRGWVPLRLESSGQVGFFLYNQRHRCIVNKKGILNNEVMSTDDFKMEELTIVKFSDIPSDIIARALAL